MSRGEDKLGIFNYFKTKKQMQYIKMLNGGLPIFAQFGNDIYASDIVQNCVDVIASECSKLQPKHVSVDKNGMQTVPRGSINRLLKFSPNELMTTRDFIEKIIWLLFLNYNAFIYPTFALKSDLKGNVWREYTSFYPLNPSTVTFLQDDSNKIFLELAFLNGQKYTLPYSDIIHLRKKFSVNEVMGGGLSGRPDNEALLKTLSINNSLLQGLEKAVKTSFAVRGIVKINTMLDDDTQKKERERFETQLNNSLSGIIPLDLKADYIPLTVDPKMIDKDTLEFLDNKVLNWFGVSLPILTGKYTDDEYEAFYQKTLEPIIISLGQAFSKTLFTQRELDVGNEIIFYQKDLAYLSTKTKLELIKTVGEQGLFTDNQKLSILGYPPIVGGEKRTVSLNFIDVNLVNDYQMKNAGNKKEGATNAK